MKTKFPKILVIANGQYWFFIHIQSYSSVYYHIRPKEDYSENKLKRMLKIFPCTEVYYTQDLISSETIQSLEKDFKRKTFMTFHPEENKILEEIIKKAPEYEPIPYKNEGGLTNPPSKQSL